MDRQLAESNELAERFRQAARSGDLDEAKSILDNTRDESMLNQLLSSADDLSGNSALHFCSANGHKDMVQLLLSKGACIDALNKCGSTPLHYAALTGQLDVIHALLEGGAKPVVENSLSRTAMDEAITGKHRDVINMLQKFVEENSSTPLNE